MILRLLAAAALIPLATPAVAQHHDHMPGMTMPQAQPGAQPAPPSPEPTYADRIWGRAAMEQSRAALRRDHGGMTYSLVMIDLAEFQLRDGRDAFRWDGSASYGGDRDRIVLKSEGSSSIGKAVDDAEVQALYSRTIGPYSALLAGLRYDIAPNPSRAYLSLGVHTLLPYWFDVDAKLFVSDHGDLLARAEASYDQRITQRLILQPRAELNLAAQDVPETGIGAGLSQVELGLRLRYEIKRELAPYVGLSYDRALGDTARLSRARGEDIGGASLVLGLRAWF